MIMKRIQALLHRPQVWGSILSIVVMAIISIAFFYPDTIEGNTLQQHDVMQGIANGEEARAWQEATGETVRWTNSLFGGMPTFQIAPEYPGNSLFQWIGKVYALGLPGASGLVMMMMMGMYWMLLAMRQRWYYALTGAIAWGFSSYFIILIGAGHIWKFITLAYVPPTLAGIILAYRGRWIAGGAVAALALMMQLAANHVQMTYYFGFLILMLAVAYLIDAIRSHSLGRWVKASASLLVAAILAVAANAPSLYNTWKYSAETIRGGHSELTQPASQAPSTATDGGLDKEYITQYSYGRSETFSLFIPNVKGGASARPERGKMVPMSISDLPGADDELRSAGLQDFERDYIKQFVTQYFGEPEGTNGPVYVGVIIFALFLAGCFTVKGPVKWALVGATLLSIGLAWGRNFMSLTDLFIDLVPMYNKFRTPESILVVAELTMPVLAILALHELFKAAGEDAARRKHVYKFSAGAFALVGLFCLAGWMSPGIYGNAISEGDKEISAMISNTLLSQGYDSDTVAAYSITNPRIIMAVTALRQSMVQADCFRSLVLLLFASAGLWMAVRRRRATMGIATVALLVLIDLYTVDKRYVSHDSFVSAPTERDNYIPTTAADRTILADTSYYRVMPMGALFQQATPSFHHKSLGGYHAAKLTRYQDLIERHLMPAAQGNITNANLNVISMLNGKYILDDKGSVIPNPAALGNAWLVDTVAYVKGADAEMAALDRLNPSREAVADEAFRPILGEPIAKAVGDTVTFVSYAPNRLTYNVNTARGGLAVFSEVYFPWGWTATLDGDTQLPIGRVDYLLRAVRLPEGRHTLVMTFDPESLHVTGTIAITAIILIYLWIAAALYLCSRCNCSVKSRFHNIC